jgi:hypothetical protein
MLKTATSRSQHYSHTTSAHPAAVGISPTMTPQNVDANRESGRWPGPLLTVLDACECHAPFGADNNERISNTPHPRIKDRSCLSKPASSQPQSAIEDD